MPVLEMQKPSHEEWLRWSQVVIDRLTTCVHVYTKPPVDGGFMPEKERQAKNAVALDLLKRIHALTDDADTPTDSLTEVAYHDERVIAGLSLLLREAADQLPVLSMDMQMLLKSAWYDKCNGRLASELFRGPMNNEPEGIGSGHPEHGRLPEVLSNLLEREQIGDGRRPRRELHRHSHDTGRIGDNVPSRQDEVKRRWADKNTRRMRSAGQVE